jgi:hypothetical protein
MSHYVVFATCVTNSSKNSVSFRQQMCSNAGIFKQYMRDRNRVGRWLSYRPETLHRLTELIPWDWFMGSLKVSKLGLRLVCYTEAESKEKHRVWDPMPELTITSPYVHSIVDSNTFTMGNPMPESTLSPRQGFWIWPLLLYSPQRLYIRGLTLVRVFLRRQLISWLHKCLQIRA